MFTLRALTASLALLAGFVCSLSQVPIDQPSRLRTILPNGAVILVERIPGSKSVALGLYASSKSAPETNATHGYRHLIEHLVARGKSGDLDRRLETAGGFLRARTLRDAICFEFTLPPTGLQTGLDAVAELIDTPIPSPEVIRQEVEILAEESAIRDASSLASQVAWHRAYGEGGLDPFGDLSVIAKATPEGLDAVRVTAFDGANLVVTVAGDLDLDRATALVSNVLKKATHANQPAHVTRKLNATVDEQPTKGDYRALTVRGYRDPATAAALAACLAVGSEIPRGQLIYTPSGEPGMVLVGTPDSRADLQSIIGKLKPNELFERGRELARRWVRNRMAEADGIVSFRGLLLTSAVDLKPEIMLENLETMKYAAFVAALESLQSPTAIAVGEGK